MIFKKNENYTLYQGDSLQIMKKIKNKSIDLIFADPPYFLSTKEGKTISSGNIVPVYKGIWDEKKNFEEKIIFNRAWIKESKRILKKSGALYITGTKHNIYIIGFLLEELGFKILNNIVWNKPEPMPLIYKSGYGFANETIIYATVDDGQRPTFHYKTAYLFDNIESTDVWTIGTVKLYEKKYGRHPTQKPLELLKKIIQISSSKGDMILDPFSGSSTTGVAALQENRHYIGIEENIEYLKLSERRLSAIKKDTTTV